MEKNINQQFKSFNIIYLAILISISVVALVSVIYVSKAGPINIFNIEQQSYIKTVVIMAMLIGIPVSHIFYGKKVQHIDPKLSLERKVGQLKNAFFIRIVVLEAIALLTLLGYLVTDDKSFLYMFGAVFVLFIIHSPTSFKIKRDLGIDEDEQNNEE